MVDRYTKMVLTVIAGCLVWLCAMTIGGPALAQQRTTQVTPLPAGVQPVVVVGFGSMDQDGRIALRLVTQGGVRRTDTTVPVRADEALPVSLPYSAVDPLAVRLSMQGTPVSVSIRSIQKSDAPWDPIRTDVEPAPARLRPGGDR